MTSEAARLRVLLIEDDLTDAELTTRELRKGGFLTDVERVDHAEALRGALVRGGWDVLLSDWSMPGFSGAEALTIAQELSPDVPFLFLSGVLGEERAVEALRGGARDFVVKGNPARLCAAIRREVEEAKVRAARKAAEAALRAEERRTRLLMETAPAGIIELDLTALRAWLDVQKVLHGEGLRQRLTQDREALLDAVAHLTITHVNSEVLRIFEVGSRESLVDNRGVRFFTSETEVPLGEVFAAYADHAHAVQRTIGVATASGRRVQLVLSFRAASGGSAPSGCVSLLDVTAMREMEERIRVGERLEALGRLAGGVAHDVNNLVTVIESGITLLELRTKSDPRLADPMQAIRDATRQAAGLTRQLLHFSRRGSHRPAVLDVNEAVRAMEPLLRRMLGEKLSLTLHLGDEVGTTLMDPSQLSQVLLNLVGNAGDASGASGTIDVATALEVSDPGDPRRASFDAAPGSFVCIRVIDQGHGMDDDTRQRVFEPFFSTKPEGRGTGLGLATVYGIVREAGGFLDMQSAPGRGTRVDVFLPQGRP